MSETDGPGAVVFTDIVGFTRLSSRLPPERIVDVLNDLFCRFDDLAGQLAPATGAASGHVVEPRAETAAQRREERRVVAAAETHLG